MPDEHENGYFHNTGSTLLGQTNGTGRSSRRARKATVKLTGYRLLNMAAIFTFGTAKAVLTYLGQSAAPTTIDWVAGVVLTLALYYIGLHEAEHSPDWDWFFDDDLSHLVIYYQLRAIIIFLGSLACWLLLIITFPYGLMLYVISLLPVVASVSGYNALSTTLFVIINSAFMIIGYKLFRLIARRPFIRYSVRTTWHYVSRGQSSPKRLPWWLDVFTLTSSGTLALFIQAHWLHDFLFDTIMRVVGDTNEG